MPNPYSAALGRPPRESKAKKAKERPQPKAKPSPSHLRAKKQEKEAAKRLRGQLTPASGAGVVKGDVRIKKKIRIECKTTKNKSFPVTLELLRKIEQAGLEGGEACALLVGFNDEQGRPLGEICIIPSYLLDEFCDR